MLFCFSIDKSGIYPLYVYDFEKKSSYKVAEHCYSRDNDNMNLIGSKTTASSKILENFVSPYNATITEKLLNNFVIQKKDLPL